MTGQSKWEKWKKHTQNHPLLISVAATLLLGLGFAVFWWLSQIIYLFSNPAEVIASIPALFTLAAMLGLFAIYPVILTGIEIWLLFRVSGGKIPHRKGILFDVTGVTLGLFYSFLYLSILHNAVFSADFSKVLVNQQEHTPLFTGSILTVVAVAATGMIGYAMVNIVPLKKMPPLVLVLGISAMYLGTFESIVWGYQVCRQMPLDLYLLLLPLNCIFITARTVLSKIREWKTLPRETGKTDRIPILGFCNRILGNADTWPFAAFLLMWPLLGILICVLILFGQSPSAVIRAWTETSDWNLSRRTAPQNIFYDEHYLCTVAAGGHRKIVKPLRLGLRHGHEVIVNRQLCIANAFEQVLEEKTPRFHRALRNFYDKYGFPVAKLIHSPYTADLVYFIMKPLEWLFLAVLYLTDPRPEDRIAVQYLPESVTSRTAESLPDPFYP